MQRFGSIRTFFLAAFYFGIFTFFTSIFILTLGRNTGSPSLSVVGDVGVRLGVGVLILSLILSIALETLRHRR